MEIQVYALQIQQPNLLLCFFANKSINKEENLACDILEFELSR